MPRVSLVPFDQVDAELQKVMAEYDEELGGSEFVRVYAHAPEVFKRFIDWYFWLVTKTRGTINMRITELARLKVADKNGCAL